MHRSLVAGASTYRRRCTPGHGTEPVSLCAPECCRDMFDLGTFVDRLRALGVAVTHDAPPPGRTLAVRLSRQYDFMTALEATYAGTQHIRWAMPAPSLQPPAACCISLLGLGYERGSKPGLLCLLAHLLQSGLPRAAGALRPFCKI